MRYSLVISIMLLLFSSLDINGKNKVEFDDYCVILVTSAECGYCVVNTAWFNSLADRYSKQIQMVALNASKKKDIEKLPKMFPGKEVTLRGWTLIANARKTYMPLVERETWPQILLMRNGKVVRRFIGTIKPVKQAVEKAIPMFIKEKYKHKHVNL